MSEDRSGDHSSRPEPSLGDRIRDAVQDAAQDVLDWLGESLDGILGPQPELIPVPVRRPPERRR